MHRVLQVVIVNSFVGVFQFFDLPFLSCWIFTVSRGIHLSTYIYFLLLLLPDFANLYIALDFRAFTASLLVSLSRWVLAVKEYYLLILASSVR